MLQFVSLLTRNWLFIALLCSVGCSPPTRPANVSEGAVLVEGAKTGWWQICALNDSEEIHCTIWNEDGTILQNQRFVPLDGGPTPQKEELQLRDGGTCTEPYEPCLKNERILVPESMFQHIKTWEDSKKK